MNDDTPPAIFYPTTCAELFQVMDKNAGAMLFSEGSHALVKQTSARFALPPVLVALCDIGELQRIDRTERYLEIGAAVTLNRIAGLGRVLPEALATAIGMTDSYLARNMLTLGGVICRRSAPAPVVAGLVALDARYEFRSGAGSEWVSAIRFSGEYHTDRGDAPHLNRCLARVRVPLETWDYTLCCDFSAKESGDTGVEFAVFLARMRKDILTELRLIFTGASIVRDRESELTLIGKRLPLDRKTIAVFIDSWSERLETITNRSPFQKSTLLNFVSSAIRYFAY
jgi:CO/xanthine dehydrogenase FAD-binding subunit